MSELINTRGNAATIRWKLLTSASAFALLASAHTADAAGSDTDHPTIWIDLGGQVENVSGQGDPFTPTFLAIYSNSSVMQSISPRQAQKPPFSFGEDGKISFQPQGSDWVFSAALRVGRSGGTRHVDHQTNKVWHTKYASNLPVQGHQLTVEKFADTKVYRQEKHAILDFSVGKDVGLGMFGRESTSTISAGVRFAQFTSKETFDIRARPDLQFKYLPSASYPTRFLLPYFHTYHATGHASRSFRGVGPSISWNASAPFAGNPQDGEMTFDWGVNAAILFGKQKAHVRHYETAHYVSALANLSADSRYQPAYSPRSGGHPNVRSVTVPNVGGFAGLSYRYQDAKISLGYRADFFFGAMDTGIDVIKKSNATFHGPYASISIGIGD
jgi:iron complex outermembrane recepter protein